MALKNYQTQDWKSISAAAAAAAESEDVSGCLDCNICLDSVCDPVVTLCGHLYCWPCIYKWFQQCKTSPPQCPICKAEISDSTVVPLYGRGHTVNKSEHEGKVKSLGIAVPPRPPACTAKALAAPPSPHQQVLYQNPPSPYNSLGANGLPQSGVLPSEVGMFGEIIYARVFGNSESLYPNSYQHGGSSSPRLRRQEMQVHKSLNRVSIFLFCCFFFCLLFF